MASHQTPGEARTEYESRLGPDLGGVLHILVNDYWWLQLRWAEYCALYGTTAHRLELANEAAGQFFRIAQDDLWEATLLHLCRMTDKPHRSNPRITVCALPHLCAHRLDLTPLNVLVESAVARTAFARDWRDRHITHRDKAHSLDPTAKPLEPASRQRVNDAIRAVHAVLDHVNVALMGSSLYPDAPGAPSAVSLLYVVRSGLEARKRRRDWPHYQAEEPL